MKVGKPSDPRKYINLPRLFAGAVVVAVLLMPFYLLVLRGNAPDSAVERPRLVDTPPVEGRDLAVGLKAGQLAPDFAISDPSGRRIRLSELRGRPLLINFWAAWCTSCLTEMPEIQRLQTDLGQEAFRVLAINAGETRERALEFIDFLNAPFAYGLDTDLTVSDAYGVYGLPLSVFIDARGVVQALYHGHASRDLLERFTRAAINAAPAEEPPPILRIVSTIPRERVLFVSGGDGGELRVVSKSLRCDASYCAKAAIDRVKSLTGLKQIEMRTLDEGEAVIVRFDDGLVEANTVVEALVAALEESDDPLYDGRIEIRYVPG